MVKKKAFGGLVLDFSNSDRTASEIFGKKPVTPAQMTKLLWKFIKRNKIAKKKTGKREKTVKWS